MLERSKKSEEEKTLQQEGQRKERRKKRQEKKIPWSVKLGVSFLLICLSLIVGLAIGYVKMGHGSIGDAFSFSTYKHMYDLVFKIT